MQLQNLKQGQVKDDIKRPPAENDRRPVPALGRLFYVPETLTFGKGFHPLLPFNCRPPLHLSEKQPALKEVWLFQLINAACNSKRALSPAADSKCSSDRSPHKDCRKVANRAEIGGIVYTNPACPLFCPVASRHISSHNSDRDEYVCRSSAPNDSSSEFYSTAGAGLRGHHTFIKRDFNPYSPLCRRF